MRGSAREQVLELAGRLRWPLIEQVCQHILQAALWRHRGPLHMGPLPEVASGQLACRESRRRSAAAAFRAAWSWGLRLTTLQTGRRVQLAHTLHKSGSSAAVFTQTASRPCVAQLTHSLSFRRDGARRHPGLQHGAEGARAAGRCLQPLPSIRPQRQLVRGWLPCCRAQ